MPRLPSSCQDLLPSATRSFIRCEGPEAEHAARRDRHFFAGLGVATDAFVLVADREGAEGRDLHLFAPGRARPRYGSARFRPTGRIRRRDRPTSRKTASARSMRVRVLSLIAHLVGMPVRLLTPKIPRVNQPAAVPFPTSFEKAKFYWSWQNRSVQNGRNRALMRPESRQDRHSRHRALFPLRAGRRRDRWRGQERKPDDRQPPPDCRPRSPAAAPSPSSAIPDAVARPRPDREIPAVRRAPSRWPVRSAPKGEARRTRSDFMKMEQDRGISVSASAMSFEYEQYRFNLVDTPGHSDFSGRYLSHADRGGCGDHGRSTARKGVGKPDPQAVRGLPPARPADP